MPSHNQHALHDILWTAGWDSTFRILDLLLIQHATVRPWYVVDPGRGGSGMEIKTMEAIRAELALQNPEAVQRLLPVEFRSRADIARDPELESTYLKLCAKGHLGGQYVWLASLARQENLANLELCVHIDDQYVKFLDDPDFSAFQIFSLPILQVSKLDMQDYAQKHGFSDLMELTWFCHEPKRGRPCGLCNPCRYTREEGMGRRVPKPTLAARLQWSIRKKIQRLRKSLSARLR